MTPVLRRPSYLIKLILCALLVVTMCLSNSWLLRFYELVLITMENFD